MLDSHFNLYLIEVNTNPLIDQSNPFLEKLMPQMLENALRLVIDPLYPIQTDTTNSLGKSLVQNKFDLVFDEHVDIIKPI